MKKITYTKKGAHPRGYRRAGALGVGASARDLILLPGESAVVDDQLAAELVARGDFTATAVRGGKKKAADDDDDGGDA